MIEFNKVIITGHLTETPVLQSDNRGHKFAKGDLQCRRTWITPDQVEHEEVNRLPFIAWGQVAEIASKHGRAGQLVLMEGRLKRETWFDRKTEQVQADTVISVTFFQTLT